MGEQAKKPHISAGLLAHVDAGKTTLSEAMLYTTGRLKKLGRVDHQDAFLDTHSLERERGITIFSKQAVMTLDGREVTLLDTPGHVDFAAETERALAVLDCAILVISGTDGIQAHTQTLWSLLRRCHVPTFIFVNKMDLPGKGQESIMASCGETLSSGCINFSGNAEEAMESAAMCDEGALEEYLSTGELTGERLRALVAQEKVFPCFFGSALRLEGVQEFLAGLRELSPRPKWPEDFAARVYKIARDGQGNRLTYLKITGGSLKVRSTVGYEVGGEEYLEKVKEIRLYSGAKYTQTEELTAGAVAAVVGLSRTYPGQGLGREDAAIAPILEPVMTYALELPVGTDPMQVMPKLLELSEEDPQLQIQWDARLGQVQARLMGQVQIEILKRLIQERFDLAVTFGAGRILYKETIAEPVEGVGHYEPLRHYAEVHLLLEPLPVGSGIVIDSDCSEDELDRNWQRLIHCHLTEKTHLGVLTGSPITDMRLTLTAGRAHLKHTEGGDFRQATYRAVRQGLMMAKSVLLEPYYRFRLTVPQSNMGRALMDLQADALDLEQSSAGALAVLTGRAPVSLLRDYAAQVAAYSRGQGRLTLEPGGYAVCKSQAQVVEAMGYDPEADLDNSPDSVFCAHGAGYTVKWNQVPEQMHLPARLKQKPVFTAPAASRPAPADDRELERIMEREFGPIRRPQYQPPRVTAKPLEGGTVTTAPNRKEYLFIDGYNILFAWDELKALAQEDLETAREKLMDILSNYAGYKNRDVVLVFDGYRVKGSRGSRAMRHNLLVVYTKENETCDMYIEALIHAVGKHDRVWVATSDSLIQLSVFRSGVLRLSARELKEEVTAVSREMEQFMKKMDTDLRRRERDDHKKRWERLLSALEQVEGGED